MGSVRGDDVLLTSQQPRRHRSNQNTTSKKPPQKLLHTTCLVIPPAPDQRLELAARPFRIPNEVNSNMIGAASSPLCHDPTSAIMFACVVK
mmetsp:Transcript_24713/g.51288  ORF Transcript_24713/g.51288 Transcript_24713/m.51288 type:complete len:91 (-) Transcript_24713:482-754(-)